MGTSSATESPRPRMRTTGCNAGAQSGVRPSSTDAQIADAASVIASTTRPNHWSRCFHISAPPMPIDRADRGHERDRVVLVDDPLTEADRHPGHEQPAPPEDERGAGPVRARPAHGEDESGDQQDQGGGKQPRRLPAEAVVEETAPPRRTPLPGLPTGTTGRAATDAAGLTAGEPAEAVVSEEHVPEAVVLRTADVRPLRCRRQLHDRDPPATGDDRRHAEQDELADAAAEPRRPGDEVDETEAGEHEERLQLLGEEREADERAGEHEPAGLPGFERSRHRVRRADEEQDQERVRVVEAEHQRGHRRERGDRGRRPARHRARTTA